MTSGSFNNLGNTCYINAILQSLFALVPFSTDLLNVTDRLETDNILSFANNHRLVVVMRRMMRMLMMMVLIMTVL